MTRAYSIDLYPKETLEKQGILYVNYKYSFSSFMDSTLSFLIYDQSGKFEGVLKQVSGEYFDHYDEKNNLIGSIRLNYPLQVCSSSEEYYAISGGRKKIMVESIIKDYIDGVFFMKKSEIAEDQFVYKSLYSIKESLEKYSDWGLSLVIPSQILPEHKLRDEGLSQIYVLRESPNDNAPFVFMEGRPYEEITVGRFEIEETLENYWFKLIVKIDTKWEESSIRDGERFNAHLFFEQDYTGYWKAPYDNNGYAYLIWNAFTYGQLQRQVEHLDKQ